MVQIEVEYTGDLHCRAVHGPSGEALLTDAPVDNKGKGEYFSPTDLTATSLVACILTTMAIYAANHDMTLANMRATVIKEMTRESPRRIARLAVDVYMGDALTDQQKRTLENVAHTCPVHRSLHPDVEAPINFHYEQ